MVSVDKLQQSANAATLFNTKQRVRLIKYTLSDSGAYSHFVIKGSPAVNIKIAEYPISIKLPDGSIIWPTHTCNLDMPWLPLGMKEGHIVPGLEHLSLVSTKKLCKAGCRVVFNEQECRVYYNDELVLCGGRENRYKCDSFQSTLSRNKLLEGLDLPITSPCCEAITQPRTNARFALNIANNLHTLPYKHQQLKHIHQSFSSPPIQTIAKASNNNQMQGIPCLNSPKIVQKYLAPLPATPKGRLKKQRGNVGTRRPKIKMDASLSLEDGFESPSPTNIPNTNVIRNSHSASNMF